MGKNSKLTRGACCSLQSLHDAQPARLRFGAGARSTALVPFRRNLMGAKIISLGRKQRVSHPLAGEPVCKPEPWLNPTDPQTTHFTMLMSSVLESRDCVTE
jgi:hypothetical protein